MVRYISDLRPIIGAVLVGLDSKSHSEGSGIIPWSFYNLVRCPITDTTAITTGGKYVGTWGFISIL